MSKMYREMTPEEKLRVINAVMNTDGFVELKKIIDEYEKELIKIDEPKVDISDNYEHNTDEIIEPIRKIINNAGLAGFANISDNFNGEQYGVFDNINLDREAIYAPEHRGEAMKENGIGPDFSKNGIEPPKARILGRENSAPNLWGDAVVVTPGQLEL